VRRSGSGSRVTRSRLEHPLRSGPAAASGGGGGDEGGDVGVLVFAVPVLLVVVLGYAVSYAMWEATGLGGNPEVSAG
jgi:hypothetical protein